ncbi:MAG: hypothetical protein NZM43_02130 [Saprospiraceae bacterium]|nr:hypothetical protein [Saprospiraceae bacterium]MDW8483098.1 hypothetical protein [Saprospiraceae bacterium]
MKAIILACKPRARFHFGGIAPDENAWLSTSDEWLRSDTLFSALINIAAEVYPIADVEELLHAFEGGKVRISSGFYLLADEAMDTPLFLLPKPAHYALEVTENFKAFNKIKFISKRVWEAGWGWAEWPERCWFLQNGAVVVSKEELPNLQEEQIKRVRLWEQEDYPRVKVHTTDRSEGFFYLTTTTIADISKVIKGWRVHFYFLIDMEPGFENSSAHRHLQTAIQMLPYRGVGGERSVGCGQIEQVFTHDFSLLPTFDSPLKCSISLTSPTPQDLAKVQYYSVLSRGGRHYGGRGKEFDFVRMMAEGAVFEGLAQGAVPIIGQNLGHKVRRYGKAFCLPVKNIVENYI